MKTQAVRAVARVNGREISADFQLLTGRLRVNEGPKVIEELGPPDSWMALASLNHRDGWGTRPTAANLLKFLVERYVVTDPRLSLSSIR
jgi:hypothetical protein